MSLNENERMGREGKKCVGETDDKTEEKEKKNE